MPRTPSTPSTVNQMPMIGPNSRPTAAVPSRCTRTRPRMIATVIGMTRPDTDGADTLTPSIADSTEIAGVIMLSPKNSEAPKIPSAASAIFVRRPPGRARLRIRAISAMIPPSPSLSARITSSTYVIVTTIVTDQKISEMTPKMLSSVTLTGCGSAGLNTVWTVYSGLVPMSPKTTPRAPAVRAHWAAARLLELTVSLPACPGCTRYVPPRPSGCTRYSMTVSSWPDLAGGTLSGMTTDRTPAGSADPAAALAGRLFRDVTGALELFTVYLGERLGLYRALAGGGPATSAELAGRTGTDERYIREWLEHHAASGLLEVDDPAAGPLARRYRLPAAYVPVLADPDDVRYQAFNGT